MPGTLLPRHKKAETHKEALKSEIKCPRGVRHLTSRRKEQKFRIMG